MNGFSKYLQDTGQDAKDFAGLIKKPAWTVARWAKGECAPNKSTMPLVIEASNGAVTANSFYQ